MTKLELYTNSRATMFLRCQQEHHYAYGMARRGNVSSTPLGFGSLVHVGLEGLFMAWGNGRVEPLDSAFAHMELRYDGVAAESGVGHYDLARAKEAVRGYLVAHASTPSLYSVVGVEQEFDMPLVSTRFGAPAGWRLAGKMDGIVRCRSTGRPWVIEHKTTSAITTPGSIYWEKLRTDSQVTQYLIGAEHLLGEPVAGVIYDVLRTGKHLPRKATPEARRRYTKAGKLYANTPDTDETLADYTHRMRAVFADTRLYERLEIPLLEDSQATTRIHRTREQLTEYLDNAVLVSRAIDVAEVNPTRNYGACQRYGSLCQFFATCSKQAKIGDDELYRASTRHAELSARIQGE